MGALPGGMTGGQMGLGLLKGGLTGLSQGLQNQQNPNQGFDFSKLQQGFQAQRSALGQGITPNAKKTPAFSAGFSQAYVPEDQRYT